MITNRIKMVVGGMTHYARDLNYYVWPVRAGQ